MSNHNNEMKKTLGLSTALATVVGSVIGSGVFFKPQSIYTTTAGAPGLGMMAWIIGGLASIAAALTFAEIAILIPKTGGMVAYRRSIRQKNRIFNWLDADSIVLSCYDCSTFCYLCTAI